jgi:DNA-binding MurR/RpiR family transcriptional regulator
MPSRKEKIKEDTVAQRIRGIRDRVAPGELSVVTYLLDNYPMGGLVSVAELAGKANVSPPTALRLVTKLGYPGYAAFQKALREEVSARLFSPAEVYPEAQGAAKSKGKRSANVRQEAESLFKDGIHDTYGRLDSDELESTVAILSDLKCNIVLHGGRVSWILAAHLGGYLSMLRADVQVVGNDSGSQIRAMLNIDESSVVVVFDYRNYQHSSIQWGRDAKRRGAKIILFTDPYLSPLAAVADTVMTTSVVGVGPFDSMTYSFSLVELIISLIAKKLGPDARARLKTFEDLQLKVDGEQIDRQTRKE